ncbi:MAG: HesA/MoeB/ThiF family protein [Bacteroidaceae bacterium]|nr:HesA/MoeB/ThiF family protein [Bacteroidaceae bacterium]
MELTTIQKERYRRHLVLDGIGVDGQMRLLQSKVLLVGVGGLGSPVALYLAGAGVGTLGLIDADKVSLSNLQRQVLHSTLDLDRDKVDSAEEKINRLNPDVKVIKYNYFFTKDNASELVRQYDFIIDCSDNFNTKYIVNDACVLEGKPFCVGGIQRFNGQLMTHLPGTACYRCLFPNPPAKVETCETIGVLGSIAGILGTIQATECIKYLVGVGELLTNQMLTFDALTMEWHRINFTQNKDCALCNTKK